MLHVKKMHHASNAIAAKGVFAWYDSLKVRPSKCVSAGYITLLATLFSIGKHQEAFLGREQGSLLDTSQQERVIVWAQKSFAGRALGGDVGPERAKNHEKVHFLTMLFSDSSYIMPLSVRHVFMYLQKIMVYFESKVQKKLITRT